MFKRFQLLFSLGLICALLGGSAVVAGAVPATRNLLDNSDFEDLEPNQPIPRGWSFLSAGITSGASLITTEEKRIGQYGVKMSTVSKDGYRCWQTVPVTAGQPYELAVWLKSDISPGGRAFLTVEFYKDQVNSTGFKGSTHSVNYSSCAHWTRIQVEAPAPAEANLARVYLRMNGPGTVYFDDATFQEVGSETVKEQTAKECLVQDGQANAIMIRQAPLSLGPLPWDDAMQLFQDIIARASGARIPIVTVEESAAYPPEVIRIVIGPGPYAISKGINAAQFAPETFQIRFVDNHLLLVGDIKASNATHWAVSYFLDHHLGVRWLWPGELGTYVPESKDIYFAPMDVLQQPMLEKRHMRIPAQAPPAGADWLKVHQMGGRSEYKFGHAFTNWWTRYGANQPEIFALPPPGESRRRPEYLKLDISNPAVDKIILAEWEAARRPNNWSVCPNDSSGFCVTPSCLAMDDSDGHNLADVYNGRVSMTARYVRFWNRLLEQMRPLNPEVTLSTYAYSAYREPPQGDLKINDGLVVGIVNSWWAYDTWQGWYDAGAKLYLRPNWWHTGSAAPHLPLYSQGAYFKFASERGMLGFDFDTLIGHWATQGPLYYLIARLSSRPELSVDEVIDEYVSAFGKAAPAVREYLMYWEWFSERAAYPADVGGTAYQDMRGYYTEELEKRALPTAPIAGSYRALPLLYTDQVLERARAILARARALAAEDSAEVQARVAFLEDGLTHLQLTRDVAEYGHRELRPATATRAEFIARRERLYAFREQASATHVVWGDALNSYEERWGFPMHEERSPGW